MTVTATTTSRSTSTSRTSVPPAPLDFTQLLTVGGLTARFECVATIIWKQTPDGWREARWHASVISADVPDELRAAVES